MIDRSYNPFLSRTKSNDLNADEIQRLWIDFGTSGQHPIFDPASPMATVVLGGKGSGKTHLFRYFSFPVQGMRYAAEDWTAGLLNDGYVGIYARADGLNGRRFANKGVPDEQWAAVFRYYIELWLADGLLEVVHKLAQHLPDFASREEDVVSLFCDCLSSGSAEMNCKTIVDFLQQLRAFRHNLDQLVNVAAFEGRIKPDIVCSPGALIFGLPRAIADTVPDLKNVVFSYYVDECENLMEYQQRHINTLLRERQAPCTFRIGARSYGMSTFSTDSGGGEEIKRGSEYNLLQLDAQFRREPSHYKAFASALLKRRLDGSSSELVGPPAVDIEHWFEMRDSSSRTSEDNEAPHLKDLHARLKAIAPDVFAQLADKLRCRVDIVTEKAAIFKFYQEIADGRLDVEKVVDEVAQEVSALQNGRESALAEIIAHYRGDFLAQTTSAARQGRSNDYAGLDHFIAMSEGLPRVLLTIVGYVVANASFRRELPAGGGAITLESQRQGVYDAAEDFYADLPKAKEGGEPIRRSIERLGELFRINRFADKPIECSLIGFSVREDLLSTRASSLLLEAEQRSFLLRGIQNDRFTKQVWAKFHLNRVLCPRYDLPIGKRGVARFSVPFAEAVFAGDDGQYARAKEEWDRRLNWPFGGKPQSADLFDQ